MAGKFKGGRMQWKSKNANHGRKPAKKLPRKQLKQSNK